MSPEILFNARSYKGEEVLETTQIISSSERAVEWFLKFYVESVFDGDYKKVVGKNKSELVWRVGAFLDRYNQDLIKVEEDFNDSQTQSHKSMVRDNHFEDAKEVFRLKLADISFISPGDLALMVVNPVFRYRANYDAFGTLNIRSDIFDPREKTEIGVYILYKNFKDINKKGNKIFSTKKVGSFSRQGGKWIFVVNDYPSSVNRSFDSEEEFIKAYGDSHQLYHLAHKSFLKELLGF